MMSVVLLCSSPPMAKLWPLASSTVVSARRTLKPGTVMPPVVTLTEVSIWLTSGRTLRLMRRSFKHSRREVELHAELLEFDRDRAVGLRDRNRELAAGEEACRLPRERHEVRLREHGQQTFLVQRIDQRADVDVVRLERAEERVRVVGRQIDGVTWSRPSPW